MAGTDAAVTPLTSRRHRDAQALMKAHKASAKTAATSSTRLQKPVSTNALPLWTCPECGGAVTNLRHVRCEACITADPAQVPEIRGRRGAAIAARKRALSEWDKANPVPSTTRSCSGERSCRGSGPYHSPRSLRRSAAQRRPRRTFGAGNGLRTFRRGRRL
jgi:hypothetical protein